MIISIEGIDFAGKTTQTDLLLRWLVARNLTVKLFKFPNLKLWTGEVLAKHLEGKISLPPEALFALFSANRLEMKPELISATEKHDIIICDRYCESEYAYGLASGLPRQWLFSLESQMPAADLVLLLDVLPDSTIFRHQQKRSVDIIESDLDLQARIRKFYLSLSDESFLPPQKWVVINAERSIQCVHQDIKKAVSHLLTDKFSS